MMQHSNEGCQLRLALERRSFLPGSTLRGLVSMTGALRATVQNSRRSKQQQQQSNDGHIVLTSVTPWRCDSLVMQVRAVVCSIALLVTLDVASSLSL
jgi:hypothetical protein